MATIANLSIGLSADSARLQKDLDKAGRSTKKWSNKQKKTFDGITASIKGMGVAIAAVGAAATLRSLTMLSKELLNLSKLTNMSTTDLQKVSPALASVGVSTEKYADILKDVNDKMHDFLQTGGGPMVDFFEQIAPKVGLTADAFKDLSGDDALKLYVKSLEDANLSQEEMTFYMEAIASDSTLLLPLLRDNAAAMNKLGLANSQVIKKDVLNDLANLGGQISALSVIVRNTLTNALGPLISALLDAAEGWRELVTVAPELIYALGGVAAAVTLVTAAMLANPITFWVTAITILITAVGFLAKKFFDLSKVVGSTGELFALMKGAAVFEFMQIGAGMEALSLQMSLIFNRIRRGWGDLISEMTQSLAIWLDRVAATKVGQAAGLKGGNFAAAQADESKRTKQTASEKAALKARLKTAQADANANNPFMAELREAWGKIAKQNDTDAIADKVRGALAGGGEDPAWKKELEDILAEGIKRGFHDGFEDLDDEGTGAYTAEDIKAMEIAQEEKDRIRAMGDQFFDTIAESFSTALRTGDWKSFLGNVLDSFASDVIADFTKSLFDPLKDFMSDAIGSLLDSLSSSGSSGGIGGILSAGLSMLGGFLGFSDGGIVPSTPNSKSYADSVPSMLQPGELVVPKDQVAGFLGGGGSGQTFNINVTGDVSRLTRKEIVRMMPEIAAGTNAVNRENNFRG